MKLKSRIKIWRAKKIHKRILKYEEAILKFQGFIKQTKKWIIVEKKIQKKILKTMDQEEFLAYGFQEGYIEK